MAIIVGLEPSFGHNQNGMTKRDMKACRTVASRLNEVIIFRSTGPWAKRWLKLGYPSKNFHVKGKSSDWGPQAGFVPYDGTYSKVGYDPKKAAEGTKQNDKGLHSGFAGKAQLVLT
ncbi:MAG TPA: anthrax toxin-like adenylyl cyclase domain-containing protein, partial [Gemmatimonadales bacterium]|nr:anthrax toxin-like adenylyl cyclase domain-containing protein [Gemmatimonadales bacterium]